MLPLSAVPEASQGKKVSVPSSEPEAGTIWLQLITPVQLARLLVQSYPWFPDTLALTTWLAAEAGDPQAVSFFSQGRSMLMLPPGPAPLSLGSRGANSGIVAW